MAVTSPDYFLFLATLFFVYWAVRRPRLAAIFAILAATCFFVGTKGLIILAFVSFFPTISMGPITPVSKLAPQLLKGAPVSATDGGRALFLIGMGLAKKFFIADFLAEQLINRVFDTPTLYSGSQVLLAAYS